MFTFSQIKKHSKDIFKYNSIRDANSRLADTILRIDGIPSYINAVQTTRDNSDNPEHGEIYFFQLGTKKDLHLSLPTLPEHASLQNLNIGYFNHPSNSYYLTRIPYRHTKQSITPRTIFHPDALPSGFYNTKEFVNMLDNKYPTLKTVITKLSEERPTLAFHKLFALTFDSDLEIYKCLFKYHVIGTFNPSNFTFKIPKKNTWIQETLKQEGFAE